MHCALCTALFYIDSAALICFLCTLHWYGLIYAALCIQCSVLFIALWSVLLLYIYSIVLCAAVLLCIVAVCTRSTALWLQHVIIVAAALLLQRRKKQTWTCPTGGDPSNYCRNHDDEDDGDGGAFNSCWCWRWKKPGWWNVENWFQQILNQNWQKCNPAAAGDEGKNIKTFHWQSFSAECYCIYQWISVEKKNLLKERSGGDNAVKRDLLQVQSNPTNAVETFKVQLRTSFAKKKQKLGISLFVSTSPLRNCANIHFKSLRLYKCVSILGCPRLGRSHSRVLTKQS